MYCGTCGWPLSIEPYSPFTAGGAAAEGKVAAPVDEASLEGQFQIRCADLISEIRSRGFNPYVWVDLINELGAVEAAKRILAGYEILPVSQWLVHQGLSELTMEREIEQLRWADLFSDAERSEASRRITSAEGH
jgi:hypothetical protein